MEHFIVSARKYRPATFDRVVGQDNIVQTLKNAISKEQLAQAFLFCGPRGIGKTTCARILAKAVNCENLNKNLDPCDKCKSCLSFTASHSFNIHELDAASNNSVDDIRTLIEQVRFAPQAGKYKVYIIDEVHMLSQSAFNAFLKTLEEPPAHAIFILATTEKFKIIPTILSRCQIYDFHRIQVEDIANHLLYVASQEKVEAEPDALHLIAQKSDGSLRDALSVFDQMVIFGNNRITYKTVIENLNILDFDYYFNLADAILKSDLTSCMLILHDIVNNGFDIRTFINGLGKHLRDLLISKDTETLKLLDAGLNLRNRYAEQTTRCNVSLLTRGLAIINQCDYQYNISSNPRLLTEIMLVQLCALQSEILSGNNPFLPQPVRQAGDRQASGSPGIINQTSQGDTPGWSAGQKKNDVLTESGTGIITEKVPLPQTPQKKESGYSAPAESKGRAGAGNINESISISAFLKTGRKENIVNIAAEEGPGYNTGKPFTEGELISAWSEYSQVLANNGRISLNLIMAKRKPAITGENKISFMVDFKSEESELLAERNALIDYLKKKFNKKTVTLNIDINPESPPAKPTSMQERYKRMVEKNPNLEKLRQELQLDINL
ncbi:MAG: DNA polymerase III subunit gamma/tau [Bacteroidetes bacterium]|nr:DNA polymerase III subunit gamma/tau [Bacteroidota bacterium]